MKVIFVANEFQTGGATKSLIYMVENLKKYNVEPIILVNKYGILTEICKKNNLKYIKLPYKAFSIGSGSSTMRKIIKKIIFPVYKFRHYVCNLYSLKKIEKLIDFKEISIIHTNTNRDDFGAIISKKYNIPHAWHLREFGTLDYNCIFLKKDWVNYMNENCTCFIAISNAIKDYFVKNGLEEKKIKVIYNGVHINDEFNIKKTTKKIKIIFAGGISKNKGQYQLINALDYLSETLKNNLIIDFYGNGSKKYIEELKKYIKSKNLFNIINFYDYCNDLDRKIRNYDIGVMCSKSEAFGRVTVEYMSNKLITIVSDGGANKEIIEDNEDGFIYKYNDFKNLAEKIEMSCNLSKLERERITNNAYNKAKNFFSDIINAQNIYKLYSKILMWKKTK